MANTREVMGEQACLDALVARTLTGFEDDAVTAVSNGSLSSNAQLTNVVLSNCISIGPSGISNCPLLETIDIKGGGAFGSNCMQNDKSLQNLVMRGSSKTSGGYQMLSGTLIAIGYGGVYVDQSLISAYESDSNWNAFTILPLSEYPKALPEDDITDSWTQVGEASSDGTYSTKYTVGDIKSFTDSGGTRYVMQLVAMDADSLADDSGMAHMTFLMHKRQYDTQHEFSSSTAHSWSSSSMRSWLANTVLPTFPADLRAVIKPVKKYTYASSSSVNAVTTDSLWIPSVREVCSSDSNTETTGPAYSDIFTDNASRLKSGGYWLRTKSTSSGQAVLVNSSGSTSSYSVTGNYGVVLGFCI